MGFLIFFAQSSPNLFVTRIKNTGLKFSKLETNYFVTRVLKVLALINDI